MLKYASGIFTLLTQIFEIQTPSSINNTVFSRANIPEYNRASFFLHLNEFQNFSTLSFIDMLSEFRKFKIRMILVHQYIKEL